MQYLPSDQGRRNPELKVWESEMMRKSCQNSVSLHFGTPESDKHIFNGELVLYQTAIEFMQYLPSDQGRRSPELKVWETEIIGKSAKIPFHFILALRNRISIFSMENRYNTKPPLNLCSTCL